MCCITTIVLVLAPRIVILYWWLTNQPLVALAFHNWGIPGSIPIPVWIWPLLGGIFLPWTTLAYLFLFPGGIVGYEWIIMAIALIIDLAGHGGSYYHRNRFPAYRRRRPAL
jgi:hypothetical protein